MAMAEPRWAPVYTDAQHSWRSDGDFPASVILLIEAGSEIKAEWLPTGDEAIDAALRLAIAEKASDKD